MKTEVEIQRAGMMGQGVGYDHDGNIYFVPGSVVGDVLIVDYGDTAKKYRDATLDSIVRPSPFRRESPCLHFKDCGGCDWLHWEYPAQIAAKEAILTHILERAQLTPEKRLPMAHSPLEFGYRNRVQLRRDGNHLGFLRRGTRDIVDVKRCEVADPRINEVITELRSVPPKSKDDRTKIEVFVREDGTVGRTVDRPHGFGGFRQVNDAQNEFLRTRVAEIVKSSGSKKVLELFSGNGNLTFSFLPFVESVIAVDSSHAALDEARRVAKEKGHGNVVFFQSMVDGRLPRKLPTEFGNQYDTLLLDPPRTGVGEGLDFFLPSSLKTIVYISCSPVSFTQDVQCLKKHFALEQLQAVDMFPHTRHIEVISKWVRR